MQVTAAAGGFWDGAAGARLIARSVPSVADHCQGPVESPSHDLIVITVNARRSELRADTAGTSFTFIRDVTILRRARGIFEEDMLLRRFTIQVADSKKTINK